MANLFTGSYDRYLQDEADPGRNTSIQDSLDAQLAGLTSAQSAIVGGVAFMVVAATDVSHPWGGVHHHEEHFSASLLKVAACYAAFELRRYARDFIESDSPATAADFYAGLDADAQPEIDARVPSAITDHLYPDFRAVLDVTTDGSGTPVGAEFTTHYFTDLRQMTEVSDDPASMRCIHGLGFGYINAKLADDGFFDGTEGLWLAGDYQQVWTAVPIDTVNDGRSSQDTSAFQMARLLTILYDRRLVTEDDSDAIRAMLSRNSGWMHFTHPPVWPHGGVDVTGSKVGVGSLKTMAPVMSEGLFARDAAGNDFVVVWQNLQRPTNRADLALVAGVVEAAISGYVP